VTMANSGGKSCSFSATMSEIQGVIILLCLKFRDFLCTIRLIAYSYMLLGYPNGILDLPKEKHYCLPKYRFSVHKCLQSLYVWHAKFPASSRLC
jgi:hypothetical protein